VGLVFDQGEGEAVVAFATDCLDGGGVEARVFAEMFEKGAGACGGWVGAVLVEYGSVADYVVSDDDGAGARELKSPLEIGGVVGLVGVEKDEVERGDLLCEQV